MNLMFHFVSDIQPNVLHKLILNYLEYLHASCIYLHVYVKQHLQ